MNLPKIGDHIIVRYANGLLSEEYLHKIYPVVGVEENYERPSAANGVDTLDSRPAVFFGPSDHLRYYTTEWQIVPKVGDIVRATAGLGDNRYYGQTCTVTQVIPNEVGVIIRGEFTSVQKPDDTIMLGFSDWEEVDVVPTVKDLQAEIAKLKADLEEARQDAEAHEKRADGWRADFYHQANMLMEEAEQRQWCEEYEEFCDKVDQGLRFGEMPRREKEYEVSWVATIIVEVPMTRTYTARDEEQAEQSAQEDYCATPESQEIIDAIRSGNWEEQDDAYREYTVEEA